MSYRQHFACTQKTGITYTTSPTHSLNQSLNQSINQSLNHSITQFLRNENSEISNHDSSFDNQLSDI